MINVQIHLRGTGSEARRLPAVPAVGSYLTAQGRLWSVQSVLYGDGIHIFALGISEPTVSYLEGTWATWGDKPVDVAPAGVAQEASR